MKSDRKGDVGFMEAMAGAMTVCIVMLCFTAFVAADSALEHEKGKGFDWTYIGGIGHDYEIELTSDPSVFMESEGYRGLSFTVIDTFRDSSVCELTYGVSEGNHISERRMYQVTDGDVITPVIVEVRLFR